MRTAQRHAKHTFDALMSFAIWTAVFSIGALISWMAFRVIAALGLTAYHWLHS